MSIVLKKNYQKKGVFDLKILGIDEINNSKDYILLDIYKDNQNNKKRTDHIFKYFDESLNSLYLELNKINEINLSKKFWKLLIGPWLIKFIEFYYDKYLILKKIPSNKKVFINQSKYNFLYKTFFDTWDEFINEDFICESLIEISKILKLKNIFEIKKIKKGNLRINYHDERDIKIKNYLKMRIRDMTYYLTKKRCYERKVFNMNLPLLPSELEIISDRNNNLKDFLFNSIKIPSDLNFKYNHKIREKKLVTKKHDEFSLILSKIILKKIPIEYFENFKIYFNHFKKYTEKYLCDIILVRSPLEPSTKIRYFNAISSELNQSKIFGFQEGGNGKLFHQFYYEKYNLIGCDNYIQWSSRRAQKTTINFYCTKTFWLRDYNINKNNKILVVLGSMRKSFFSYFEGNLPNFPKSQIQYLSKLLNCLDNQQRITLRFHKDFGYGESQYFNKFFPNIKKSNRSGDNYFFYNLLSQYSLKIFTSDYTANVQSLLINHPTIFLWDKKVLSNNEIYDDIYDLLLKRNILFYDPIKCSKFINNLSSYDIIHNWWFDARTQEAKDKYLATICRFNKNIKNSFRKLLN